MTAKRFMELVDRNFEMYIVKLLILSIIFAIVFEVVYVMSYVEKDKTEELKNQLESKPTYTIADSPFFVPLEDSSDVEEEFEETLTVSEEELTTLIVEEKSSVTSEEESSPDYKKHAKSLGLPEDYDVDKAIQGMEYLVNEQKFSVQGAAGIIGNLFSESRFNGSEVYGSHKGIAQWDVNRWPLIEEWLYVNNYKDHSFLGQLMAMFESEDGKHFQETFHAMRKMKDAEVAALYFLERYEKAPGQAESERQSIAQLTYELYTLK